MAKSVIIFLILIQSAMAQAAGKYSQVKNANSINGSEGVEMYKGLDGVGQWHAMGAVSYTQLTAPKNGTV